MMGVHNGMRPLRMLALALLALALLSGGLQAQTKEQIAEILREAENAETLKTQGRYPEAFERAVAVRKLILDHVGENHPNHALIVAFLGDVSVSMGRKNEAETFYREALAIMERARGPNDPQSAATLLALGDLYAGLDRYAEAETLFDRALAIREKASGKDHVLTADAVAKLASLYEDMGRHHDAERAHARALAIRQTALGQDSASVAYTLDGLAVTKQSLGKHEEAEALYKRALAIHEKVTGKQSEEAAGVLHNLSDLNRVMGRYQQAETYAKAAIASREKVLGRNHVEVGRSVNSLGNIMVQSGRYEEAEALYKRGLVIREKALGPDHSEVSLTVNNLAAVYMELGRYEEAETLYRRSLAIREKTLPPYNELVAEAYGNLGVVYNRMGRLQEAERLHRRALEIREKNFGPDHHSVGTSYNNLAALLGKLGRQDEAAAMFRRSLAIREKSLGPDHPDVALSLANVAIEEDKAGRRDEAEKLYTRALSIREKALGPRHPDVADSLEHLALFRLDADRLPDALSLSRRAAKIVIDRLVASSGNGLGLDGAMLTRILDTNLDVLRRLDRSGLNAREAFEIMQRANQSSAAAALNQMAARFGSGSDQLAVMVRRQQDAAGELQSLNKVLLAEIARPANERRFQQEQTLRADIAQVEERLQQLNDTLKADFPRYAELVDPKPLPLQQVQSLLGPDEALLVYHIGARAQFVFAITRERAEWRELGLDSEQISAKVRTLRDQLDPDEAEKGRARFDLETASDLYAAAVGPVENAILSKPHLLLVAAGPLTSLPLQVLLTQPPQKSSGRPYEDYLTAPWLGLRHSITVLPSVGSIQVLREVGVNHSAPQPYIGFGDPVFQQGGWGTTRAASAPKKSATRTIAYRDAFRGSRANTDRLSRALPPLPDTADELRAIAKTLKLSDSVLRLGARASESTVKTGRLGDYRIVHFATHALVAGETALFSEQAEPALALTVPKAPSDIDDGLLTSSEVAALKLNANWVILSACNTAAGDKPGAEALTGLARAFFYAGARTLLVSHWPVQSAAAVRLTTRTIALLEEKPQLPPAEALRIAMTDLMKDRNGVNAHPAIWAPFVVVGTMRRS